MYLASQLSAGSTRSITLRRKHQGFTLIELLVVIAIIAILVALLLPAVQSVREAARSTQCKNNLHQLAIAVTQYAETATCYPAKKQGTVGGAGTACDSGNGQFGSGLYRILPFMEQNALYTQYASPGTFGGVAFSSFGPCPWTHEDKYTPYRSQVTAFICPSDPGISSKTIANAASNYKMSVGDSVWGSSGGLAHNQGGPNRGVFGNHGVYVSFANLTDGTSNTIVFSERLYPRDSGAVGQGVRYNVGDTITTNPAMCLLEVDPANKKRFNNTGVNTTWGYKAYHGSASHVGFTTVLPPNAPACASAANDDGTHGVYPPSSYHPGGVHVAMADGVVKFASENIDTGNLSSASPTTIGAPSPYGVWGALGSVGGGESGKTF